MLFAHSRIFSYFRKNKSVSEADCKSKILFGIDIQVRQFEQSKNDFVLTLKKNIKIMKPKFLLWILQQDVDGIIYETKELEKLLELSK